MTPSQKLRAYMSENGLTIAQTASLLGVPLPTFKKSLYYNVSARVGDAAAALGLDLSTPPDPAPELPCKPRELRTLRRRKNLTLDNVADAIGLHCTTVGQYELGKKATPDIFQKIYSYLITQPDVDGPAVSANSAAIRAYMRKHGVGVAEMQARVGCGKGVVGQILHNAEHRVLPRTAEKFAAVGIELECEPPTPRSKARRLYRPEPAPKHVPAPRPAPEIPRGTLTHCACGARLTRYRTVVLDGARMCVPCHRKFFKMED